MRRKQLYIDDDIDEALKRLSAATGRSEAHHVRQALRAYLPESSAAAAQDASLAFIGVIDDNGPVDLARELDHYAYGVPKDHKGI